MRQIIVVVAVVMFFVGGQVMVQSGQAAETSAAAESRLLVERFLTAFEAKDTDTVRELLAEDVVLVQPLTFSGRAEPEFVADGRAATLAYFEQVFANFSQIRFVEPVITVSEDGGRVFVETRGDFIVAQGNRPYSNVYVFRNDIVDGRIVFINEYANPVTASAALGIPLGTPPATD